MKIELALLAGDESKKWLANLTKQIDRLEEISKKIEGSKVEEDEEEEDEVDEESEEVDDEVDGDSDSDDGEEDEEDSDSDSDDEEEEEEEEPAPKKKKGKKLSSEDCNDAAKACALSHGKEGRAKVLKLLKKHFKTETVSELGPEQYGQFIDLMKKHTKG